MLNKSISKTSLAILFLVSIFMYGCVQTVWFKPNAYQGEFEQTRYKCLQESQQRVVNGNANGYQANYNNRVVTNDQLFGACMAAKGWSLQQQKIQYGNH